MIKTMEMENNNLIFVDDVLCRLFTDENNEMVAVPLSENELHDININYPNTTQVMETVNNSEDLFPCKNDLNSKFDNDLHNPSINGDIFLKVDDNGEDINDYPCLKKGRPRKRPDPEPLTGDIPKRGRGRPKSFASKPEILIKRPIGRPKCNKNLQMSNDKNPFSSHECEKSKYETKCDENEDNKKKIRNETNNSIVLLNKKSDMDLNSENIVKKTKPVHSEEFIRFHNAFLKLKMQDMKHRQEMREMLSRKGVLSYYQNGGDIKLKGCDDVIRPMI